MIMKDYIVREGIVLESILNKYLLISTEAALDKCSYVRKIDDIVAYYWEMMENGLSVKEMAAQASSLFGDVDEEVLKNDIWELIRQLKKAGYLLSDEEMKEVFTSSPY